MERPTDYWWSRCRTSLADNFSDSPEILETDPRPARDAGL